MNTAILYLLPLCKGADLLRFHSNCLPCVRGENCEVALTWLPLSGELAKIFDF